MLTKLLYFGSNKKSFPLLSPPGYRPTRIYAHQKRSFSGCKPWAYIRNFMVYPKWNFVLSWKKLYSHYFSMRAKWNIISFQGWSEWFGPLKSVNKPEQDIETRMLEVTLQVLLKTFYVISTQQLKKTSTFKHSRNECDYWTS